MPDRPSPEHNRFGRAVRDLFALEPETAQLNHGSYGATPRPVLAAQQRWTERLEAEPSRFMRREFRPLLRRAAESLAPYLGAKPEAIALVESATTAANAVLRNLALNPGDEILVNDQTYGAVLNTVRYVAARTGATVIEARLPFPATDEDAMVAAFEAGLSPRTRLAVLDHITSPTALVLPVARMVAAARKAGALVFVDGAHAPGQVDIGLTALGADWYTGNCHKWLCAPKGSAFLWSADPVRGDTHPAVISHGFERGYVEEFDWIGTRDATAQFVIPDCLAFRAPFGDAEIKAYNRGLALSASEELAADWGTETGAAAGFVGSMATIRLPDGFTATFEAAEALRDRLMDEHRIQVPVRALDGALWVRISAQIYNEADDYRRLSEAIRKIRG